MKITFFSDSTNKLTRLCARSKTNLHHKEKGTCGKLQVPFSSEPETYR